MLVSVRMCCAQDESLEMLDEFALDAVYRGASSVLGTAYLARESVLRQSVSLYTLTVVGGIFMYLFFATLR